MKRYILTALIAAFAIAAEPVSAGPAAQPAGAQPFEQFVTGFVPLSASTFGIEAFGSTDPTAQDIVSIDRESPFLPSALRSASGEPCQCPEKDDIFWHKGSMRNTAGVCVLFMNRLCDNSHDNALYCYDYVVATYTADGRLIDNHLIGRSGGAWKTDMKGSVAADGTITLDATRHDAPIPELIKENAAITFAVSSARYTISPDGRIARTSLGSPRSETVATAVRAADKSQFGTFVALFKLCTTDDITSATFAPEDGSGNEISHQLVKAFLTAAPDPTAADADLMWTAGSYIRDADRYVFFLQKSCGTPRQGLEPYAEFIVATCTADGQSLDMTPVAVTTDVSCACRIAGSRTPLSLTIRQARLTTPSEAPDAKAEVHTSTCTVDSKGHITVSTSGPATSAPFDRTSGTIRL